MKTIILLYKNYFSTFKLFNEKKSKYIFSESVGAGSRNRFFTFKLRGSGVSWFGFVQGSGFSWYFGCKDPVFHYIDTRIRFSTMWIRGFGFHDVDAGSWPVPEQRQNVWLWNTGFKGMVKKNVFQLLIILNVQQFIIFFRRI